MDRTNPVYVPRNHLVEEALAAAIDGDLAPSSGCSRRSPRRTTSGPASSATPSRRRSDFGAVHDLLRHLEAALRAVRRGEAPLAEVVARLVEAEAELSRLRTASSLPEQPDRAWVDGWLHRSYTSFWAESGLP